MFNQFLLFKYDRLYPGRRWIMYRYNVERPGVSSSYLLVNDIIFKFYKARSLIVSSSK